jgi:hypothetical protein
MSEEQKQEQAASAEQPQKSLIKQRDVYPESCCYGCFHIGPRETMPGWLCKDCVEKRAAAKLEKESKKDE